MSTRHKTSQVVQYSFSLDWGCWTSDVSAWEVSPSVVYCDQHTVVHTFTLHRRSQITRQMKSAAVLLYAISWQKHVNFSGELDLALHILAGRVKKVGYIVWNVSKYVEYSGVRISPGKAPTGHGRWCAIMSVDPSPKVGRGTFSPFTNRRPGGKGSSVARICSIGWTGQ